MKAKELMSSPAVTCSVNDPLTVAAQRMWDHDCGALPITRPEDGKLVGMITDRDICMAAYTQGKNLEEILVNSVFTGHVISGKPDQSLTEIEELMAKHQIRRIPIVDAAHKPIGVVSLNDIIIESAQPDSRLRNSFAKVIQTLAGICDRRQPKRTAA